MAELPRDMPGENLKGWLAGTSEQALDPAQPIIDPHHHLWDRRPRPELGAEARQHLRYLGDDLIEDIRGAGHNVVDTVFVECRSMYREGDAPERVVGETEFVQGVAAMAESGLYGDGIRCCGAMVGFVDLTWDAGVVEDVLRAHMAAGRCFRGIRHAHGWHASPQMPNSHHPTRDVEGLLGNPAFRAGFAVLGKLGLTFDCWGYHGQLDEVAALANAFPDVTVILNHIGGPVAMGPYAGDRQGRLFDEWRAGIDLVAGCPNVVAKVGGCGMVTYGFGFENLENPPDSAMLASAWGPYLTHVIDRFGPSRSMFESNFPVDKLSCSYGNLWNAFKRIARDLDLSAAARNALFYGTAARAYSMDLSADLKAGLSG